MPDINELAEKKLKSRVRKIKKVNKSAAAPNFSVR